LQVEAAVSAELRRDVIVNDALRVLVRVDGIAVAPRAFARPKPQVTDDDVVAADGEWRPADPNAARRRLPGNGDAILRHAELSREIDPAADVEDDRATAGGSVLHAVTETADADVGEVGHMINVTAAAAERGGAVAFGLREGFDLSVGGCGEE
jgi:hypothetical protein